MNSLFFYHFVCTTKCNTRGEKSYYPNKELLFIEFVCEKLDSHVEPKHTEHDNGYFLDV